jgi:hypothetical protein
MDVFNFGRDLCCALVFSGVWFFSRIDFMSGFSLQIIFSVASTYRSKIYVAKQGYFCAKWNEQFYRFCRSSFMATFWNLPSTLLFVALATATKGRLPPTAPWNPTAPFYLTYSSKYPLIWTYTPWRYIHVQAWLGSHPCERITHQLILFRVW